MARWEITLHGCSTVTLKIRAKRLAKLGGSTASSPGSSSPKPPAQPTSPPAAPQERPIPTEPSKPKPPTQPSVATEAAPRKINIKPAAPKPPPQEVSIESWEDRTIGSIFRITLDPNQSRDAHGLPLYHVSGVRDELQENNRPVRLTKDTEILESAIQEATSSQALGKPLDYLLGCWKRVSKLFRGMHNKADPKYAILQEARRLCFNYCILAATIPEMFGEESSEVPALADYLLVDPNNDRGICHDFLNEAVSRFGGEDEEVMNVKQVLVEAMEELSRRLAKLSMNDDYTPYVLAMRNFVRYKPLLVALSESPRFLPENTEPQNIETDTLLGPFFSLSPMQGAVALNYFSSPTTRDKGYVNNSQKALRMTLQTHQDELFDVVNCFIKLEKASRERMLDWFALSLNTNHKRRALQVDPKTTASDGFMVNVTVMLDRLCEPFMDATFSKIDRIDIDYLRRSPRIDISDETKINADQHASDDFYANKAEGTNNFISEVFFLTVAAHHYGTEAANTKLSTLQREVKYLEKQLAKLELERHKFISNPLQLRRFDSHVKKVKDSIERGHCVVLATQGVLLDDVAQARSMHFMRYVIVWLLRLASNADLPKSNLPLPLPKEQPTAFQCLPEYFVEDIVDNFKFITRHMPHIVTSTQCEELVKICITFLRSSEYIKNPYLKSGLVTILFYGIWEVDRRSKGILGDVLFANSFCTKHLLHSLMKFYIECESTGAHTQFYDKFNIRYEIFQVIKCIWPNPIYRENLATEARVNLDFFVHFVNLLLNDVTYVLDESFTAFKQIHELSKELKSPPESMDPTTRQQKEEALSSAQGRAKSYMQLTNETVSMLKLFTEALSESFTMPEIVQRLAHMLDYNLDALVGPKQSELRVENPDEYGWHPRTMLSDIVDVFLNLREKKSFIDSVATDGRSYKPENFQAAGRIMQSRALKGPEQLQEWEQFALRVQEAKEEAEMEEADLGEVPDEFTDPIMATLMEDPVTLPNSKAVVDRSTIRSHLLSDPNDPFNRMPLTIDQVIPNDELKAKIQAWKAEKRAEKAAERSAAQAGGEPMDTT
ncbi:hypothetical protein BU24DRAFT_244034 [Aaosphaeria arxii CBS 175.79]|uniref:U-box domain-containing protein n=1 Tax=Aaosphaeria arxii CBS 175.79 TaxID=1450172 RepID=A0A6A5XLG6_9PLEO|nr:uncharacterized protein BU24DRAFT_244034 [Aaosphaeria arxii CBS 175.79]KAF2013691.1 hypothetical protein BU24DRAFT_244034 [Aaosphaeria arxii CBS 175.79]